MDPTPGQAILTINGVEYPGTADEILGAFSQVIAQLKEEGTALFTANRSDGLTEMILVNQGTQMSVKTVSSDGHDHSHDRHVASTGDGDQSSGQSPRRVVLRPIDPSSN